MTDNAKLVPVQTDPFNAETPIEALSEPITPTPLVYVRNPDVLLVWALNDEPLPLEHGYPVRLIVPSWYGMASVKWLVRISALSRPFEGYFQKENYVYEGERDRPGSRPVTHMRTRSVISWQADGSGHPLSTMRLLGMAWSGHGSISHVEISTDQGSSWSAAELGKPLSSHSATPWQFEWNPSIKGSYEIMVRATDDTGNTQPLEPVWNVRGFGNNAVERIRVTLR